MNRATNSGIADSARIDAESVAIGANVAIGDGVRITARRVTIVDGARIDADVTIDADEVSIGHGAVIEQGSAYRAIGGPMRELRVGDFAFLGHSQNVLVPVFAIGDYTAIHNSCLINGYKPCTVGHNCWIGQDTILNSTETLTLGNNVRIGTGSRLWTHVASGELLEGCTLYGEWPLTLEDDVWVVGGGVVSPNLVVAKGTIVMTGAVLTKSTQPRHIYAGVPAADVTEKLRVYRDVTLDDKREMMARFIEEFHESTGGVHRDVVSLVDDATAASTSDDGPRLVIVARGDCGDLGPLTSCFSLETKRYTKRRTPLEQRFIRFHLGHRARFVPVVA